MFVLGAVWCRAEDDGASVGETDDMRSKIVATLGLILATGTAFSQCEWWQNPALKYKASTGVSAPGAGPHYWNKDEGEQYLFCPVGFLPGDAGVLYSLPALVSATSSAQVVSIVTGSAATLHGGAWKGGALSDDLGRILTGNGDSTTRHASLPIGNPCAWTKDATVFSITNAGSASTGIDGMAFSHDSLFLYSNLYNPSSDRNKIRKWTVGNLGAGGIGLTSNATFITSLGRVRNVAVYYINGQDLIYYGEGSGGGKVCVMDPATGVETVLVNSGLPTGSAAYDIMNVKVAGIQSGHKHLYVQMDGGALYIYDLAANGKAAGACVKSFTKTELQGLLGASWPNMRAFEVLDNETHAFFSHHWGDGAPSINKILLYVVKNQTPPATNAPPVANAQSVTTAEDAATNLTLTGSDPEGSNLTYTVLTPPAHGTLAGTGTSRTYIPATNYYGADSFTFQASDGALDSAPATVSLTVTPVNDTPTAAAAATPTSGTAPLAVSFTATGVDVDNDTLSYYWTFGDGAAAATQNPTHTYTNAETYTATVTVADGHGAAATGTVAITVTAPPTPEATNTVASLLAPVITPNGGTFDQPLSVSITPSSSTVLSNTPGWRTGVKYPGQALESVEALTQDGTTVAAIRGRTMAKSSYLFPSARMSPDRGLFPFYIWNLSDTSDTQRHSTYYTPSLYAGITENTAYDGNVYSFSSGVLSNRVFLLLEQHYRQTITLYSCGANWGLNATDQQQLTQFALPSVAPLTTTPLQMEFAADKVRLLMGGVPFVNTATDAAGWITYTGPNESGRVNAPLGATRCWFMLAGGELPGPREVVISDKPLVTTRYTYDGSDVTESSLVVTGKLTLTHDVTLKARSFSAAYPAPSEQTAASFDSLRPELPAESYVSPAYVDLYHASLDGTTALVSLEGPSGTTNGLALDDNRFVLRYPLSATGPTPVILHRSGIPDLATNILWREIDLGDYGHTEKISLRLGESLLLTAGAGQTGAVQIAVLDADNQVCRTFDGVAGEKLQVPFDRPGTFTVTATLDGAMVGSLIVHVIFVNFDGPIACQVGFQREKGVEVNGPLDHVFFTSRNANLEISVKEQTAYGARLYLKPTSRTQPVIVQARLDSSTGPVLAEQKIDAFDLDYSPMTHIVVNEETSIANTYMTMKPWVPNQDVNCEMFAHFSAFADGSTAFNLNTSDFSARNVNGDPAVELIVDPATGETQAVLRVDFGIPPEESSYCFHATFDQHSKYGTSDGYVAVNGGACKFTVDEVLIASGCTLGHTLPTKANPDNATAHRSGHVMRPRDFQFRLSATSFESSFNCASAGTRNWDPDVYPLDGATAGKHGVTIDATLFSDKVVIFKVASISDADGEITSIRTRCVGQKISLVAKTDPVGIEGQLTWEWDIPERVVKDYQAYDLEAGAGTYRRAKKTDLVETDTSSVNYYWFSGFNNKTVTALAHCSCLVSTTSHGVDFTVERPGIGAADIVHGEVRVTSILEDSSPRLVAGDSSQYGDRGINASLAFQGCASFSGDLKCVQRIRPHAHLHASDGGNDPDLVKQANQFLLDTYDPYDDVEPLPRAESRSISFRDTPSMSLPNSINSRPLDRADMIHSFEVYAMFKPQVAGDAIWVPLNMFTWSVKAYATNNLGVWVKAPAPESEILNTDPVVNWKFAEWDDRCDSRPESPIRRPPWTWTTTVCPATEP